MRDSEKLPAPKNLTAITDVIGTVYAELDANDRPILVAIVERTLGNHYRQCASKITSPRLREQLLSAARHEDLNASTVVNHVPLASEHVERLKDAYPQLESQLLAALTGLSMQDQFEVLAEAERAGAHLYVAFANASNNVTYRDALLECSQREHENAAVLDSLVAELRRSGDA